MMYSNSNDDIILLWEEFKRFEKLIKRSIEKENLYN